MKYWILILLFVSSFLTAQQKEYYFLEGKVGNYPATMELMLSTNPEDNSSIYFGTYYYNSQEIPLDIYQSIENTNKFELISWGAEEEIDEEKFSGQFLNDTYKGTWTKGNQKLSFEFKTSNSTKHTQFKRNSGFIKVPITSDKINDTVAGTYFIEWFLPTDQTLAQSFGKHVFDDFTNFENFKNETFSYFEKEYKADAYSFIEEMDGEYYHALNYEFLENVYPVLNTAKYLVMAFSSYAYTGGAHGMSQIAFFTYDKISKKWIELPDVLNLDYTKQINQVLDKAIRAKHHLPASGSLSEAEDSIFLSESVELSENFTLSKKGITFHYGLYEMTPYAYGYYELFVPYESLKPYLNKSFSY